MRMNLRLVRTEQAPRRRNAIDRALIRADQAWMEVCKRRPWTVRAAYAAMLVMLFLAYVMASAHEAVQQLPRGMV